jgi:hypothetical protein
MGRVGESVAQAVWATMRNYGFCAVHPSGNSPLAAASASEGTMIDLYYWTTLIRENEAGLRKILMKSGTVSESLRDMNIPFAEYSARFTGFEEVV